MIDLIQIENPFEPHIKKRESLVFIKGANVKSYGPNIDGLKYIVNGNLTEPDHIPKDGDQIIIVPNIEGGIGNIFKTILTVGVMLYATSILGGLWGGAGKFFAKGMLGSYLAAGAVMYIGGRLINAIIPQKTATPSASSNGQERSQTYSWNLPVPAQAEGNIVGETYGSCIPAPQILSQHIETVNGQQYLNLLLCGGMGPVDSIENIRIGYNDIGNYTGVTIEKKLGTNDQTPISFFDNTPVDQSVDLLLDKYPLTQTTVSKKATALEVTFQWPGGLYYVNDDSNASSATVNIKLEYRQVNESQWHVWKNPWAVTEASTSAVTKSIKIDGLKEGQYQVRCTLVSKSHSGTRASTATQWSTFTSFDDGKYSRPGKVLVGLRMLATNQLSGGVPAINWTQTRSTVYVYDWDKKSYVKKAANNPIWAAYDILHQCRYLKNTNTGKYEYVVEGIPAERFKAYWDQWKESAAYSDEFVKNQDGEYEKRFMFDAFFDTSEKRLVAAQKAATVGHSTILARGSDIGIVTDKPGTICQIFGEGRTTVSSVSGYFTSSDERARAVEITYNERNNDFKNTQFLMRSNAWNGAEDDNTAELTLFGVSRRSQAYREGVYQLATNERQLQFAELSADVDAMVSEFGDIIGFAHSSSQIGIASGRIRDVYRDRVVLDREVDLESGRSYQIMVQRYDDVLITKNVSGQNQTTDTVFIDEPFSATELPQQYDVYCFGERNRVVKPFRVVGVSRTSDLLVTLKLAEYDEAIYSDDLDYDAYPVIDYTPPAKLQQITELSVAELTYKQADGTLVSNISLSWNMPRGAGADSFVIYYSENGKEWQIAGSTMLLRYVIPNMKVGKRYYVRVAASLDGVLTFSQTKEVVITGKDVPPQNVKGLKYEEVKGGVRIYWEANDEPDIRGYNVYCGQGDCSIDLCKLFSAALMGTSSFIPVSEAGRMTVYVEAIDNGGNVSEAPARLKIDFSLPADVKGFVAVKNGDYINFLWDNNNSYRYEIRWGNTWEAGRTQTVVATCTYNLFFPIVGTQTFSIKAINEFGNYSKKAATVTLEVTDNVNRNIIAVFDQKKLGWPGIKHNMEVKSEDIILSDNVMNGEYYAEVVLPEKVEARNWIKQNVMIVANDFVWEKADVPWEEAQFPWLSEEDKSCCTVENMISIFEGTDKLIETAYLNGSLDLIKGSVDKAQHIKYDEGRFHKGVKMNDLTVAEWTVSVPSVFNFSFNARYSESSDEHQIFLELLNQEEGYWLRVGYVDNSLYLLDSRGQMLSLKMAIQEKDIISFYVKQQENKRIFQVKELSMGRNASVEELFSPLGSFNKLRLG